MKSVIFIILFLAMAINAFRIRDGEGASATASTDEQAWEQELEEYLATLEAEGADTSRLQSNGGLFHKAWNAITGAKDKCIKKCEDAWGKFGSRFRETNRACKSNC